MTEESTLQMESAGSLQWMQGHLLGSACIEVWITEDDVEKKIVFSGDVGNTESAIDPVIRSTVKEADYVVMESTYGDRSHGVSFRIM